MYFKTIRVQMLGDPCCLTYRLSQTHLLTFLSGRETKIQRPEGRYIRACFQLLETLDTSHYQCARNCFDGDYETAMRTFERLPASSSENVGLKTAQEFENRKRMVSSPKCRR